MKSSNLFKVIPTLIYFLSVCALSPAKDIYVSPTGLDTNDGASTTTPLQTLSRAISVAEDLDVIHVLGWISIKKEPSNPDDTNKDGGNININGSSTYNDDGVIYNTWNAMRTNGIKLLDKELTIRGANRSTCGFLGEDTTRLFRMDNVSKKIKFESLTFKDGCSDPNDDHGAGFLIRSSAPDFHNCVFENNRNVNKSDGGAFYFDMQINDKTVFSECTFQNNGSRENGGDFFILTGTYEFLQCYMLGTNLTGDNLGGSRGGAFFIRSDNKRGVDLYVKRTLFQNYQTKGDGGVVMYEDGGDPKNNRLLFEACFFNTNISKGKGGAVFFESRTPETKVKAYFINTTFYRNQSNNEGGALDTRNGVEGSELNIINCTFSENKTLGGDDNGAGICFQGGADMIKRIYNTILEYNACNNTSRSDLSVKDGYIPTAQNLIIDRSFIGATRGGNHFANYINNNEINYDLGNEYTSKANFAFSPDFFIEYFRCIPLSYFEDELQFYSTGVKYGNSKYLQDVGIDVDQLGWKRPFIDGVCCIGSVEVDDRELMTLQGPNYDYWTTTSIKNQMLPALDTKVYYFDNSLTLEGNSQVTGNLNIQVFTVSGSLVTKYAYFVHPGIYKESIQLPALPRGIYIVSVQLGEKSKAVKFIN
ncbi:MAG: T9SS type A sorting domain-containing protein [Dysgonamonadaceae bacterium]|jgi:hypothetical protein|nr:T9SS type A sorting domain-containing protein [Dysgonamonadaceae bacterium]